jgi:hypothetical protein
MVEEIIKIKMNYSLNLHEHFAYFMSPTLLAGTAFFSSLAAPQRT